MKKTLLIIFALALINLIALLFHGLGASTVVDENGRPLAGVHVVAAYWIEGPYFVHARRECVRVETMVTGIDGKFDFPFFSGNFNPTAPTRETKLAFFKAGYELLREQKENEYPKKMRLFSGDATQRFDTPGDYHIYSRGCPDYEKKLYPLLLAIHAEAKQIAKTYKERRLVIGFEYEIDLPKLGEVAAKEASFKKWDALKKITGVENDFQ